MKQCNSVNPGEIMAAGPEDTSGHVVRRMMAQKLHPYNLSYMLLDIRYKI